MTIDVFRGDFLTEPGVGCYPGNMFTFFFLFAYGDCLMKSFSTSCFVLLAALITTVQTDSFGTTIADSVSEFSETQGQDGWYFGYYDGDLTADTFKLLPNYDGVGIQDNVTLGWSLQLGPGGYWTTVLPQLDIERD
ncbi:MAG: hypothetical protein JXM70_23680 [Pirellulales bacterium]|nr:hypothetical protein [Pirellulales bacterium]